MTKAMNLPLSLPREHIDAFCRRWRIATMSMSRNKHPEETDLGVFVRFDPEADWNLTDRLRMQRELQQLSGHGVQLLKHLATRSSRYTRNVVYDA